MRFKTGSLVFLLVLVIYIVLNAWYYHQDSSLGSDIHGTFLWLSVKTAKTIVAEINRNQEFSLLSTDGIRKHCSPYICDIDRSYDRYTIAGDRCRFNSSRSIPFGSCIYINAVMFEYFVGNHLPSLPTGRNITLVTDHYRNQPNPDGQDNVDFGFQTWKLSNIMEDFVNKRTIKSMYSVNLYWEGYEGGLDQPAFTHCLPIGVQNTDLRKGRPLNNYAELIVKYVINRNRNAIDNRKMLLLDFKPGEKMKPDRTNACLLLLQEGWVFNGYGTNDWKSWMELITQYKFTLIPHSHALDSYRMMEVLLMGGIPVIRRSTISSCYDSSDNASGNTTRGSLPIVIVNTWSEVTKEFLESEWLRIAKVPSEQWDVSRLLLSHWVQRLRS